MTNIIIWYKRNKEKKLAIRFANELAFHMHSVYTFLLQQNCTLQSGSCVKEAIGLLDHWKKVSDNLYEHKPTGLALEIRPESKVLPMTTAVLDVELGDMLAHYQESEKSAIASQARRVIDDYFAANPIKDRFRA
jgi:hypothetical protein